MILIVQWKVVFAKDCYINGFSFREETLNILAKNVLY